MATNQPTPMQKAAAWGVHSFTASGILTVFMALLATAEHDYVAAMWWLLAAQFIDGVDGTLARYFKVEEVLPNVSGKAIDFVIDFAAYAIIPAYLIYQSGVAGEGMGLWLAFLILITSALYYGMEGMISDDHYFVGFPVMWNMAAFYLLFIFGWGPWGNAALIIGLAVLQFVPIKFAYPSRTRRWRWATIGVTLAFIGAVVGTLAYYPELPLVYYWVCVASLAYFAIFALAATYYYRDA